MPSKLEAVRALISEGRKRGKTFEVIIKEVEKTGLKTSKSAIAAFCQARAIRKGVGDLLPDYIPSAGRPQAPTRPKLIKLLKERSAAKPIAQSKPSNSVQVTQDDLEEDHPPAKLILKTNKN